MSAPGRRPDWFEHVLVMRETIGRIDERLGAVESRLDRLEARIDRLEDALGRVQSTMHTVLAAQTVGFLGVIATILATQ